MINQLIEEREGFYIFHTEKEGYKIVTMENGIIMRDGIKSYSDIDKEMKGILYHINFIKGIYS